MVAASGPWAAVTDGTRPTVVLDLDLGDDAFVVREHSDGMVTIETTDRDLLLSGDQFRRLLERFVELAAERGVSWPPMT